jgi:hypothetical protein
MVVETQYFASPATPNPSIKNKLLLNKVTFLNSF